MPRVTRGSADPWGPIRAGLLVTLALALLSPGMAAPEPVPFPDPPRVVPIETALAAANSKGPARTVEDPRAGAVAEAFGAAARRLRHRAAGRAIRTRLQDESIRSLKRESPGEVEVWLRPGAGTPRQLKGPFPPTRHRAKDRGATPELGAARAFLHEYRELLRLEDPDSELVLERTTTDDLGRTQLRFSQVYRGVPVWPTEIIVHVDATQDVVHVDAGYVPTPENAAIFPRLVSEKALAVALERTGGGTLAQGPELVLYVEERTTARLAWRMEIVRSSASRRSVVLDAATGGILRDCEMVRNGADTGPGLDEIGATRSVGLWEDGGEFYLLDASKAMFDPLKDPLTREVKGAIITVDFRNQDPDISDTLYFVKPLNKNDVDVPSAVGAAFNLSETYDYYVDRHARNSIDDRGMNLIAVVRYGQSYYNAFWNGAAMWFGDAAPFATCLDVVAHEFTHGVVEFSANLEYQFQSGALNEAYADIFGESVEAYSRGTSDWIIGTELASPFRNVADPGSLTFWGGNRFPSKMSEFYTYSKDQDHGGVHFNCTIIAHAFYLLAQGMPGAIGRQDAELIFYRALTSHLTRNSQFMDARLACVASAEELFGAGSVQALRTAEAYGRVELGEGPPTPGPGDYPAVSGADSTLYIWRDKLLDQYVILRREIGLGDSPDGRGTRLVTDPEPKLSRIHVEGNGETGIYVSDGDDAVLFSTEAGTVSPVGLPATGVYVHSVAISPDGERYAFVALDGPGGGPTDEIWIVDIGTGDTQVYELEAPVTDGGTQSPLLYANAMDFSADNRFLLYDATNDVTLDNGVSFLGWGIYGLDLLSGAMFSVIPPDPLVPRGNPSLAQTNDGFMVLDSFDPFGRVSGAYAADLNTGEVTTLATHFQERLRPSYNGDDTKIIYGIDAAVATGQDLVAMTMSDRITPATPGRWTSWIEDATHGVIYRRGTFTPPNHAPDGAISTPVEATTIVEGASVSFSATGSDPNGHYPLAFEWDFDGAAPSSSAEDPGEVAFPTPGVYEVSLEVTDSKGLADPTPSTRVVTVLPDAEPFAVYALKGKVSFRGGGKEKLTMSGSLPLGASFSPTGAMFSVDVGGVTATFTLDAKGKAKTAAGKLKLKYLGAGNWTFKLGLKAGSFAAAWADEGLVDGPGPGGSPKLSGQVQMESLITVDGDKFENLSNRLYKGKQGKGVKVY